MKKEDAVELADKCLKELAASLEQGQTEVLENVSQCIGQVSSLQLWQHDDDHGSVSGGQQSGRLPYMEKARTLGQKGRIRNRDSGTHDRTKEGRSRIGPSHGSFQSRNRNQCLVSEPSMCSTSVRPRVTNYRSFRRSVVHLDYNLWRVLNVFTTHSTSSWRHVRCRKESEVLHWVVMLSLRKGSTNPCDFEYWPMN